MVMRQVKFGHTTWHNLNVFSQNHIKMPYERPSDSDMGMVYVTVSKGLTIRQTYFVEAVITTGCLIARYHLTYFTSNWMYKAWKVFFRDTSTGRWSLKIVNHMSNVFQSNLLHIDSSVLSLNVFFYVTHSRGVRESPSCPPWMSSAKQQCSSFFHFMEITTNWLFLIDMLRLFCWYRFG